MAYMNIYDMGVHGENVTSERSEIAMTEKEAKQLEKLREKMGQIREQEKAILARDRERQRKERTRRLIQIGAIAEKYFDCVGIESQEFEKMLRAKVIADG